MLLLAGATSLAACSLVNAPDDAVSVCGDGIVDPGEACDDGNDADTDSCHTDCTLSFCGDGFGNPDEEACDDGNDSNVDDCLNDCTLPSCGDGFLQDGVELCDDGNQDNTDACPDGDGGTCSPAVCGDGFVLAGGELCDDGNDDDTDACRSDCTPPVCGDGNIQPGESCDDGNMSNTDGCPDGVDGSCQKAFCGDGFLFEGMELCDDGNGVETDDCPDGPTGSCAPAMCGDGFVWDGMETCDNGIGCGPDSWTVDLGMPPAMTSWGIYTGAPPSQMFLGVPFGMPVFGTDGNQTMPYPSNESENSATQSPLMIIPATLDFESWNVDEGTNVDNKMISISIDGGMTFTPIMDCKVAALNPPPGYPMCEFVQLQRPPDAWDMVSIVVPPMFVGQVGIIKIDYDTQDGCCNFEQGWYMRNANFFALCP